MDKLEKYIPYLTLCDVILGIIVSLTQINLTLKAIIMILIIAPFFYFICSYKKQRDYISFVEYLFHNERHRFSLLPRIRMYMNQFKICNKVNIKELNVDYTIDGKDYQNTEEPLCGDVIKTFRFTIDEMKGTKYTLVFGDDYSFAAPVIKIKYGSQIEYTELAAQEYSSPPYIKSVVRCVKVEINRQIIPQKGTWPLEIRLEYKKAFDFQNVNMDTIVSLPRLFGNRIEKMRYIIKLINYDRNVKYYCFFYKIAKGYNGYEIVNKDCDKRKSSENDGYTEFEAVVPLDNIRKEQAFYFRVGTSNIDKENVF